MNIPNIKKLKEQQMVAVDCIKIIQNYKNKNYWIYYCKVEEDLIYYNFGYELFDTEDVEFISMERGLIPLEFFIDLVKNKKTIIKKSKVS